MKLILLTVGKTDVSWVREGLQLYVGRLQHYVKFDLREIPELKGTSALSEEQIRQKEGAMILREAGNAEIILLDERGNQYRSLEFASWLQDRLNRGGRDICFVIGGAYGFSREVYEKASGKVSLSKMTFSHQMVRTIFAEQLYRAFTIIKGEPYHHE
ncbi:MAG: 23S rRNA (pseudouridine(1915)-N(3))-methyltransferase RlmH [Bacteroidales bacterium]|nr:23S rRNA (pseudouridine(1915)-N(3))-methyltransferase RlmH [Bacteroidales bacterium]